MPDETNEPSFELEENDLEDDGTLDASDTLDGDPGDDPLDTGIEPPDRWSASERFGTTLSEERAGESLDQLLAEEEPESDPYAEGDLPQDAPLASDYPEPGLADSSPRTRERTRTPSRTWSHATWESTAAPPGPRKPRSTFRTRPTSSRATARTGRSPRVGHQRRGGSGAAQGAGPGKERGIAFGAWGAITGIATSLGGQAEPARPRSAQSAPRAP